MVWSNPAAQIEMILPSTATKGDPGSFYLGPNLPAPMSDPGSGYKFALIWFTSNPLSLSVAYFFIAYSEASIFPRVEIGYATIAPQIKVIAAFEVSSSTALPLVELLATELDIWNASHDNFVKLSPFNPGGGNEPGLLYFSQNGYVTATGWDGWHSYTGTGTAGGQTYNTKVDLYATMDRVIEFRAQVDFVTAPNTLGMNLNTGIPAQYLPANAPTTALSPNLIVSGQVGASTSRVPLVGNMTSAGVMFLRSGTTNPNLYSTFLFTGIYTITKP